MSFVSVIEKGHFSDKEAARKRLKRQRDAIPAEMREAEDVRISEKLIALPEFQEADLILSYISSGSEVDTFRTIEHAWGKGKRIAAPISDFASHGMEWFLFEDFDQISVRFGWLAEPDSDKCTPLDCSEINKPENLAIVPGLAYDRQGFRLGYGGGFYDRFLSGFKGCSVGLCRRELVLDSLGELGLVCEYDQNVDMVLI